MELIEDAIIGKYPARSVEFEKKKLLGKEKLSYKAVDVLLTEGLFLRVIKRDMEPVTAFPVLEGTKTEFAVGEVLEWKKWPEANISGAVLNEHSPAVVFYATDYWKRGKSTLTPKNSGLSWRFWCTPEQRRSSKKKLKNCRIAKRLSLTSTRQRYSFRRR